MKNYELTEIPAESELARDIQENLNDGAQLEAEIKTAEAELAGPADVLLQVPSLAVHRTPAGRSRRSRTLRPSSWRKARGLSR